MGEDATTIDVGDDDHRAIDRFGKAHVGNVARPQVDFGRRSGAFDHHRVVLRGQPPPGSQNGLHRPWLVFLVVARIEVHRDFAVNDHLRLLVGRRLEQHRVEISMRQQAASQRLQRLGPTNFATVDGDGPN